MSEPFKLRQFFFYQTGALAWEGACTWWTVLHSNWIPLYSLARGLARLVATRAPMITTGWITRLTVAARLVQISYPGVSSSLRTCTLEGTEHVGAMSDRGAIIQLRWGALVDVWKRKDVVLELFLNFFRGSLFTFKKIKHLSEIKEHALNMVEPIQVGTYPGLGSQHQASCLPRDCWCRRCSGASV